MSSPTLIPVPYRTSRIALSLIPKSVLFGGASISLLTSCEYKKYGNFLFIFGVIKFKVGLTLIIPSL